MCLIKLVVFDLDNVIIDGEGIDEIGKLVNVEDQIAAITEQAMQGELNFETSIKQRVGLLEGAAVDDIKKLADEMPLMAGAEETVKSLKENGFDVIIISGSFDIIANTIKQKLPVDEIFTNSLVSKDGVLTGEVTPRKYRIALYLHYVEEYSSGEIARILKIPQSTVLTHLSRGRKLLRKKLAEAEAYV